MTSKINQGEMQKQVSAFADLHSVARQALAGNVAKAVEVQAVLAESAADIARLMIDAAERSRRDIAQMTLHAVSSGDPVALMTLAPRAAQTGLREAMSFASDALQAAGALGKAVAAGPESTADGADRS